MEKKQSEDSVQTGERRERGEEGDKLMIVL